MFVRKVLVLLDQAGAKSEARLRWSGRCNVKESLTEKKQCMVLTTGRQTKGGAEVVGQGS